jgi:fibronectin-binding autotransporter adhesin
VGVGVDPALGKNWVGTGTAPWAVGSNWNPASVPTTGEVVNIVLTDGADRTVTYNVSAPSLGLLSIDLTNGAGVAACTLSIAGANSLSANGILVGGYNGSGTTAGRGTIAQSAGTVTTNAGWDLVVGYGANSTGLYTLSGGALVANQSEYIAYSGTGTVTQTAGSNTINASAGSFLLGYNVGANGTYNLSGTGTMSSASHEYIGYSGTGSFIQSAGSNTITGGKILYLGYQPGSTGTYTLSGTGTFSAGSQYVGYSGTGTFNHSSGTNTVSGGGIIQVGYLGTGTGTYNLSGTGILTGAVIENVGVSGNGYFNQTGGTNTCSTLQVGASNNAGVYFLGAGSLTTTGPQFIGNNGTGTFTQSGGTNSAFNMFLGNAVGATGTYNLSGGSSAVSGNMNVAGDTVPGGTGVLSVSGTGVLTLGGSLVVYNTPGTSVTLGGGTINTAALNFNGVPSLLNWTSGTLNLTSNVTWNSAAAGTTTSAAFGSSKSLGSNQTLMITGNETLGGTGAFALTLNSGSTHYVTGGITLSSTGTITQNTGSTLYAATITQSGGTVNGTLQNQGNFIYQSGSFNGRLLNQGTVSLGPSFTAGNGMQNDTSVAVATGQSVILNGAGLDNQGTITLSGGTLSGAGPLVNNGLVTGYGTIGGTTAGFTNAGSLTVSGGSITLSNSGANANTSSITVSSGLQLKLTGGALANTGSINLNGGNVSGASTLNNNAGGLIFGSGTISSPLSNNAGGTVLVQDGTINLTQATTNAGTIVLDGPAATLTGAAITNSGIIRGDGTIANAVTNGIAGEIRAESGKTLLIANLSGASAGSIKLQGGTVQFSSSITNAGAGLITGRGYLYAPAGLTNNGQMQLSTGTTDVEGNVTSGGTSKIIVSGGGSATFYDNVTMQNNSEFRVSTGSIATFFGDVTGTNFFTGTGTINFEAGQSAVAMIARSGTTIVQQGATLNAGAIRENVLTVNGAVTIPVNGTSTGTSKVTSLSVAGTLNLTDNKLIVATGGIGAWNGSIYTGVSGEVQSGFSGGAWNGDGIITSMPDALIFLTTISVVRADEALNLSGAQTTTWGGQVVTGTDALVMYTYAGDLNADGRINADDYAWIDLYSQIPGSKGYGHGDINYDGAINADDYAFIDVNVIRQGIPFQARPVNAAASSLVAVPEPGLGLAGIALLPLMRRRRR